MESGRVSRDRSRPVRQKKVVHQLHQLHEYKMVNIVWIDHRLVKKQKRTGHDMSLQIEQFVEFVKLVDNF